MPHLFAYFQLPQSVACNLVTEGHFIYATVISHKPIDDLDLGKKLSAIKMSLVNIHQTTAKMMDTDCDRSFIENLRFCYYHEEDEIWMNLPWWVLKVVELQRLAQWLTHSLSLSQNTPRPTISHTICLFPSNMFDSVHYFNFYFFGHIGCSCLCFRLKYFPVAILSG